MIVSIKRRIRRMFRSVGIDVAKAGTIEVRDNQIAFLNQRIASLDAELASQKACHEAYKDEETLVPLRPERYRYEKNTNHDNLLTFTIMTDEDFNWLEEAIARHGYYEKPRIWSFTVDADKRTLAEMIRSLKPQRILDIGCANGPLLQALDDLGIAGEGVEIAAYALGHALARIKNRIHHGDLLAIALAEASYDVISGLDIFEHLNPNRIDEYVTRVWKLLKPGGYLFANIPAFGRDEVFGEVFEYYLPDWENQRQGTSYFKTLHVDMHGYPLNGHLIWADTKWWTSLFERHGFDRDTGRERELHRLYDDELFYARRSFYLFRKPR